MTYYVSSGNLYSAYSLCVQSYLQYIYSTVPPVKELRKLVVVVKISNTFLICLIDICTITTFTMTS